jgi:hypothetical protein
MCVDAANYKSFKGTPATNILNGIYYQQSDQNGTYYKVTNGTETVYIPSLGYVTSKYVDFYNDYNGGSGVCCPNLFSYGTGLVVSPSTTYTYSIIYKTTTGYSHPNYMYRYEYNSGGGYVTESGVHNTSNRTSLGDDWWFAWGQFTTQATTATLNTYLFHYEYATRNRVYVYKAALYAGTYIIRPEHMLNSSENRGSTVATGGGWADLIGNGNNGELVNGPTYSSANGGSIVFDGTNNYIDCPSITVGSSYSIECFFNSSSVVNYRNVYDMNYTTYAGISGNVGPRFEQFSDGTANWVWSGVTNANDPYNYTTAFPLSANAWYHTVFTMNGGIVNTYVNGNIQNSNISSPNGYVTTFGDPNLGRGFVLAGNRYFSGKISNTKIYNKALSASEISQNFNALRGRYGI